MGSRSHEELIQEHEGLKTLIQWRNFFFFCLVWVQEHEGLKIPIQWRKVTQEPIDHQSPYKKKTFLFCLVQVRSALRLRLLRLQNTHSNNPQSKTHIGSRSSRQRWRRRAKGWILCKNCFGERRDGERWAEMS